MAKHRDALIVLIGGFKLVKAAVLIGLGIGGLLAMPDEMARKATEAIRWMGIFPGRTALLRSVGRLWSTDRATAEKWGGVGLCYAAVFLVEGVGLLCRKRWAEWLTVAVTASFIPVEVYEIVEHFSAGKVIALVLNIAIVAYLVWRRVHEHRSLKHRIRAAVGAA